MLKVEARAPLSLSLSVLAASGRLGGVARLVAWRVDVCGREGDREATAAKAGEGEGNGGVVNASQSGLRINNNIITRA